MQLDHVAVRVTHEDALRTRAETHRAAATRMKGLLTDWLARVKSPLLETVNQRPVIAAVKP